MFEAFKKYAVFKGRSPRKEIILFYVVSILATIIASIIDAVTGLMNPDLGIGPITAITLLALVLPSISVAVRRFHDMDLSGWWYLVMLTPLVSLIALIALFAVEGTKGDNRFGSDPKAHLRQGEVVV